MRLNRDIKILLYGSNLWYLGEGMLGPLFAIFTEQIGGDILDISWAWATYFVVTGFMFILVGKKLDGAKNNAHIMVIGYALNALFTFAYLFVSSPWHLLIVQAGLGVAAAFATPTWNALYAQHEDKNHDTLEWGLAGGEAKIITGIAIILGGLIISYFSFKVLFIIMGMIQILATLYQAQILKRNN